MNQAFETGQTPAMLAHLDTLLSGHMRRVRARLAELGQVEQDLRSYLERIRATRK